MKEYTIALVGNPNVGKQTIFRSLTGANQQITSWPNKSVVKYEGKYLHGELIYHLLDLPSVFSLDGTTIEEKIVRDYLLFEPAILVLVCNTKNFKRNLSFLLQVQEITGNIILYINKSDNLKRSNRNIDYELLSSQLHCPVVVATNHPKEGLLKLIKVLDSIIDQKYPSPCKIKYPAPLEEALNFLEPYLSSFTKAPMPLRYIALMLIINQKEILQQFEDCCGFRIEEQEDLISILLSIRATLEESNITSQNYSELITAARSARVEGIYNEVVTSVPKRIPLHKQIRSAFKKE